MANEIMMPLKKAKQINEQIHGILYSRSHLHADSHNHADEVQRPIT